MDCLFCVEDSTRFKSVYKYPFHEAIYGESSEHFYNIQTAILCFRKTSDPTLTVEFKSTNVVTGKWTNTLPSPPKKKKKKKKRYKTSSILVTLPNQGLAV